MQVLIERINQINSKLTEKSTSYHFETREGNKYYKIVEVNKSNGVSVHAFVNKQTGYMYKPNSFRGPAKHVRYQLLDDTSFQQCLDRADPYGGYLYIK